MARHAISNQNMVALLLILLLIAALPTWPYSVGWGVYPSGGLGLLLAVVVILAVTNRGRI